MNDDWIDRKELNHLVSGFSRRRKGSVQYDHLPPPEPPAAPATYPTAPPTPHPPAAPPVTYQQQPAPVYAQQPQLQLQPMLPQSLQPVYAQAPQVAPVYQQPQQVVVQQPVYAPQQPVAPPIQPYPQQVQVQPVFDQLQHSGGALQVLVNPSEQRAQPKPDPAHPPAAAIDPTVNFESPFSIDLGDETKTPEAREDRIEELKAELNALQDDEIKEVLVEETEPELTQAEPDTVQAAEPEADPSKDRIPLDIGIDPYLSLNGRLQALSNILTKYVGMEEMSVIDRDGFVLFSTTGGDALDQCVGEFLRTIRKVYDEDTGSRNHSASQLSIEEEKWLCIVPSDGELEGKYLMKGLLNEPLDRPEVYILIELLGEVLRPN